MEVTCPHGMSFSGLGTAVTTRRLRELVATCARCAHDLRTGPPWRSCEPPEPVEWLAFPAPGEGPEEQARLLLGAMARLAREDGRTARVIAPHGTFDLTYRAPDPGEGSL